MKLWGKKMVLGLIVAAFIVAGIASPLVVQATEIDGFGSPGFHHRQLEPDKIAEKIADIFGVDKEEVLKYHDQGVSFIDLSRASFLSKAGSQPLKIVMASKTYDNTWKDVANSLGITKEQKKATRNDIASTMLDKKLHIAKQTSLQLMQQGFRARDIAVTNELAKATGKPLDEILSMRKINNTWHDVAETLGVDDNTFQQSIQNLKAAFPRMNRLRFANGW